MKKRSFLDQMEFSLSVLLPETFTDRILLAAIIFSVLFAYLDFRWESVTICLFMLTNYLTMRMAVFTSKQWKRSLEREKDHIAFLVGLQEIIEAEENKKVRRKKK